MQPDPLALARQTLHAEAASLELAAERLGDNLTQAVRLILDHPGKLVVTCMGKSGHIGRTLAVLALLGLQRKSIPTPMDC